MLYGLIITVMSASLYQVLSKILLYVLYHLILAVTVKVDILSPFLISEDGEIQRLNSFPKVTEPERQG